jgi:hypothetical protein
VFELKFNHLMVEFQPFSVMWCHGVTPVGGALVSVVGFWIDIVCEDGVQ